MILSTSCYIKSSKKSIMYFNKLILFLFFTQFTAFAQISQVSDPIIFDIGNIRDVDLSYDGELLLIHANAAYVYEASSTLPSPKYLLNDDEMIYRTKFFPNSHKAVLGLYRAETLAELYDGDTGAFLNSIPNKCTREYGVTFLSFTRNPTKVFLHKNSNVCADTIWDIETNQTSRGQGLLTFPHDIQFSADGEIMALKEYETISLMRNYGAQIIQKVTSEFLYPVMSLSPYDNQMAYTRNANTIQTRILASDEVLFEHEFENNIISLAYSLDGKNLAAGDSKNQIHIVDLATHSVTKTIVLGSPSSKLIYTSDGLKSIYFSSDKVELWDVTSAQLIKTIRGGNRTSFAMIPHKNQALIQSGDKVNLWDLDDWSIISEAPDTLKSIEHIYQDADLMWGTTKVANEQFTVYDINSGDVIQTINGFDSSEYQFHLSGNGKRFAAVRSDEDGNQYLSVWDCFSSEIISSLVLDNIYPTYYALSYYGDKLLFTNILGFSEDYSFIVDVSTLEVTHQLYNQGALIPADMQFSVEDKFAITTNRGLNSKLETFLSVFFIWDLTSHSIIQQISYSPYLLNPRFSNDCKYLIANRSYSASRFFSDPSEVVVWNIETGEEILSFVEKGVPELSDDNHWIITRENGIKLWDVSETLGINDYLLYE